MIRPDVGDDAHRRPSYLTQVGSLAEIVHSHLNDRSLMPPIETEERLRNSQPVVQIAFRLEGFPALRHHTRDHFLRRRLSITSRDGHDGNAKLASMICRQLLVGPQGISHTENKRHPSLHDPPQRQPGHII